MSGEISNPTLASDAEALSRYAGDPSTSGDNAVIAAPSAGYKLRIWGYALQGHGTVNAKFTDGASGSQLSMTWNFQAREGAVVAVGRFPLFECSAATALVLNLSAAVECGCEIVYDTVPV